MTKKQIESAIKKGAKLWWNDPDPIKGNDYTVDDIEVFDEMSIISYNKGNSEAEVYNHELSLKPI